MFGTLLPAYGRDYKSKAAVLADFNAGKDFILRQWNSRDVYVNKQDLPPGARVEVRYAGLRKVFIHAVN